MWIWSLSAVVIPVIVISAWVIAPPVQALSAVTLPPGFEQLAANDIIALHKSTTDSNEYAIELLKPFSSPAARVYIDQNQTPVASLDGRAITVFQLSGGSKTPERVRIHDHIKQTEITDLMID